jgi:hypothetical protein
MKDRYLVRAGARAVAALLVLAWLPAVALAQASYTPPRTPWGDPDLEGNWGNPGTIFFERDAKYTGMEFVPEKDIADQLARAAKSNERRAKGELRNIGFGQQENYNAVWGWSPELPRIAKRTSVIIDPPDGLLPPWTMEQVKWYGERIERTAKRGIADWTPDRAPSERCIVYFREADVVNFGMGFRTGVDEVKNQTGTGQFQSVLESAEANPAFNPGGDGANPLAAGAQAHIIQQPGFVMIIRGLDEFSVVPLDKRPHLPENFRHYQGDSRGWFEGDTLVVETKNLKFPQEDILQSYLGGGGRAAIYPGTGETLRVVERYQRVSPTELVYTFTVDDPKVWTRPWTGRYDLELDNESAEGPDVCKEGIDAMGVALYGYRMNELEAWEVNRAADAQRAPWFELHKKRAMEAAKTKR